jgi:hypothetical protein
VAKLVTFASWIAGERISIKLAVGFFAEDFRDAAKLTSGVTSPTGVPHSFGPLASPVSPEVGAVEEVDVVIEVEATEEAATAEANPAPTLLHMRVFPKYRTLWRSVVRAGIVQVSVTLSPLRDAWRSVGGFGNSSDGGSGAPIEAHPLAHTNVPRIGSNFLSGIFMRNYKGTSAVKRLNYEMHNKNSRTCVPVSSWPAAIIRGKRGEA